MTNQNSNMHGAEDVIDVQAYTLAGKQPPHGKKYLVKVDEKSVIFDHPIVTGEEILIAAGKAPIECHSLYVKLKHCDMELVRPHEKVDLTSHGVEHFVTKPPIVFHYFVDKEPETTEEEELTPNQILELAGITPVSDYYLVRVNSDGSQVSYRDTPDKPIRMECPALKFISIFKGETPVS